MSTVFWKKLESEKGEGLMMDEYAYVNGKKVRKVYN